ncbi:hypothetical protein [Paenibacillus sp. MMO-58]|uniref:hypothetical protein n=1 Tax=Paenibacillus sp. MMO-58 TaxID=3081290 RepID=UPI003018D6CA
MVKRYADWKGDLHVFLKIGDLVDEEMVNHFLNELPPTTWTSSLIQMGEPYSHVGGKATYATLKKTSDGWAYAGHCHRGENIPAGR